MTFSRTAWSKDEMPSGSEEPNPLRWVDEWSVPGLSAEDKTRIQAELLKAHALFCRSSPSDLYPELPPMQIAFDGIAQVLFAAGILTGELLEKQVPLLVLESAIAGQWWRLPGADELRTEVLPGLRGHDLAWQFLNESYSGLFAAQKAEWLAKLLVVSIDRERPVGKKPVRRNPIYEAIDREVRAIAAARPKNHEEVFRFLDDRRVPIPRRRPFNAAGGWLKGFHQDRRAASTWLSQAWARLDLRPFPRGPKK
jgi:hypothetical protein